MNILSFLKERNKTQSKAPEGGNPFVQTSRQTINHNPFFTDSCSGKQERDLYKAVRDNVPILDGAILKLVRLVGGFHLSTGNKSVDTKMMSSLSCMQVGASSTGIESFVSSYLEQMLTYGTAIGEMVIDKSMSLCLYNASLDDVEIVMGKTPLDYEILTNRNGTPSPVTNKNYILLSALNPEPGKITGCSILKGTPFLSSILMQIYDTIGVNFERIGNLRFTVTYNPGNGVLDKSNVKERATQLANEWSGAMSSSSDGVRDFIAVGDVSVKAIGAEGQTLETQIPVRQLLEQILAKTGIPPFLLGLSWSTTERMSSQQADILTTEIEYYRRILSPVVMKIARTWLYLNDMAKYIETLTLDWDDVSLQDEVEEARAGYIKAQTQKLIKEGN